jgi:hypothetical protein
MFNFCGILIIFELLLLWTLVSPSQSQINTLEKGVAKIINKNFGELEHKDCADALQVIMCFRWNTSFWN